MYRSNRSLTGSTPRIYATDMLVHPVPKHAVDNSSITADDCYMYGMMLYCGNSGCFSWIRGQEHIKTSWWIILRIMLLSMTSTINTRIRANTGRFVGELTRWSTRRSGMRILNDYGDEHINSRWLNLPRKKQIISWRGCDFCGKGMSVITSSAYVNESMKYLCLKMGVLPTGSATP
jgi:hypothetical protein